MTCVDCNNPNLEFRVGDQCAYHALITGNNAPPLRQGLAVTINPVAFEKAEKARQYYAQMHPARGRKFGPWDEREVQEAYAAANRVAITWGIG